MSERRSDDSEQKPPASGGKNAESVSADGFAYSPELTEKSAQRAFGEGMDAAGMALSLRALEAADAQSQRPQGFIRTLIEERAARSKQDAVSRILESRARKGEEGPSRG